MLYFPSDRHKYPEVGKAIDIFLKAGMQFMRKMNPTWETQDVASAGEQTGLIPALPEDDEQAESYESLYPIHEQRDVPSPNKNGAGAPPFTKKPGR